MNPTPSPAKRSSATFTLALHDRVLQLRRPLIVGIVNLTPDSFSDGGHLTHPDKAVSAARRLIREGADILDLGAESSRPGAEPVSEEAELERLGAVLPRILDLGAPVSIDTYKPRVAATCLEQGAHLINDITGLGSDMLAVAAKFKAPAILMHMTGTPQTMQEDLVNASAFCTVYDFLANRVAAAKAIGVETIADIGFGFGKTVQQNIELLRELDAFHRLGVPLLVGTSRKSSLGALTGQPVDQRLTASLATAASALERGAHFLRVHDVAEHRELIQVSTAIRGLNSVGTPPNTRVQLERIPVDLHLGVPDSERASPQRVDVDLTLHFVYQPPHQVSRQDAQNTERDDVNDTLDYTDLPQLVQKTAAAKPVRLLETLAKRIATALFDTTTAATIELRIHKPAAAAAIGCGGVILERSFDSLTAAHFDRIHTAYIGLGSNLGGRRATLDAAVAELRRLGIVRTVSEWAESAPEGEIEGPNYLNGVVGIETLLDAEPLLSELLEIERRFGRKRSRASNNGSQEARTLDLDLLLFDQDVIDTQTLKVPHPRMLKRSFVLEPLAQIAPHAIHPIAGTTILQLTAELGRSNNA